MNRCGGWLAGPHRSRRRPVRSRRHRTPKLPAHPQRRPAAMRAVARPANLGCAANSQQGPRQYVAAPAVSTGVTVGAGTSNTPSAPTYRAPRTPRVITKCVGGDGQSFASCSLAITTSAIAAKSCKELRSWPAGEALTMTTASADWAARAAASAVATGISNWVNSTSQLATAEGTGVRCALAPGATSTVFSALASTTIIAVPLGPGTVTVLSSPTALARRWARSWAAAGSSPNAPENCTCAPARAAATAWLAPFPPGVRVNDAASTVSPGRGSASTTNVRSMFTLPTTHTRGAMGPTLVSLAFAMLAVG